jgi:predicted nucleic acid-binding protein
LARFLADTNLLSEPMRSRPSPSVMAWLAARTDDEIATSVVCIGELLRGTYLLSTRDPTRAATILAWIAEIEAANEILSVDRAVMDAWARIRVAYPSRNSSEDTLIAATAVAHGLTVATRNTRDFEALGVPVLDPWAMGQ